MQEFRLQVASEDSGQRLDSCLLYTSRVRILDFISGAVYALGGRNQRVSDLIFLLAPANVDVSNLLEEDMLNRIEKPGKTGGF